MTPIAPRKFNAAADTYAGESHVQKIVCADLADWLPATVSGDILELGCGTGALTAELVRRFPGTPVTAVDAAPGMIRQAAKRISKETITWVTADARFYRRDEKFPLIVSSSALHWMLPLRETFGTLRRQLNRGGELIAALMVEGTLSHLSDARRAVAPGKQAPVPLPAAAAVIGDLREAGFAVKKTAVRSYVENYPDVDTMLRSLRRQGVTGKMNPEASLLSKKEVKALKDYLHHVRGPEETVRAEYQVLFIKARAPGGN
ncbi:MAG: methyltransferase domain-containing protein [Lentisphaeria bacterium]|nr:methyltransferase domain-containing protein [Lentisphaeria bacterium]